MAVLPTPRVAVCFSGWLAVRIPKRGATARRHLVDVLNADVFVAGTFLPSDACAVQHAQSEQRSECLLRRLHALRPFARTRIDEMLSIDDLRRRITQSPNWASVSSSFRSTSTFGGVNVWAPLLGDRNLSVLRELNDYSRAIRLVGEHERGVGRRYERVCFSRLEYHWLAPHPPMALLQSGMVWLPSGGTSGGINDRHALMDRAAAEVYFRRWELLFAPDLMQRLARRAVLHEGPEQLLLEWVRVSHLRIRYFPSTMALACCGRAARCYLGRAACVTHRVRMRGGVRLIGAKYLDELKFAERHAAALSCPGAQYIAAAAAVEDARAEARAREASVAIALPVPRLARWHPDPRMRGPHGQAVLTAWAEQARRTMSHAPAGLSVPVYTHFVRLVHSALPTDGMSTADVPAASVAAAEEPLHALLLPDRPAHRSDGGSSGSDGVTRRRGTFHTISNASRLVDDEARESVLQCPTLPRYWWPRGAVSGYCEATDVQRVGPPEGDCEHGGKGTFPSFGRHGLGGALQSLRECVALCAGCARCRYVSMSLSPDVLDCSWYAACDLERTHTLPMGPDFVSVSLRDARKYRAQCVARFAEEAC